MNLEQFNSKYLNHKVSFMRRYAGWRSRWFGENTGAVYPCFECGESRGPGTAGRAFGDRCYPCAWVDYQATRERLIGVGANSWEPFSSWRADVIALQGMDFENKLNFPHAEPPYPTTAERLVLQGSPMAIRYAARLVARKIEPSERHCTYCYAPATEHPRGFDDYRCDECRLATLAGADISAMFHEVLEWQTRNDYLEIVAFLAPAPPTPPPPIEKKKRRVLLRNGQGVLG